MSVRRLPAPRRRRQLVDVAMGVFARRGFHQTSMNEIAGEAGVTKPVLYQHFESKRELYLELIETSGDELLVRIEEATRVTDSPRLKVVNGCIAFFEWEKDRPEAFQLLFGGGTRRDPEFASAAQRIETTIAEFIAPLIAADVDEEQRILAANALVGLAIHTNNWLRITEREFDAAEIGQQVADLAWSGLRGIRRHE